MLPSKPRAPRFYEQARVRSHKRGRMTRGGAEVSGNFALGLGLLRSSCRRLGGLASKRYRDYTVTPFLDPAFTSQLPGDRTGVQVPHWQRPFASKSPLFLTRSGTPRTHFAQRLPCSHPEDLPSRVPAASYASSFYRSRNLDRSFHSSAIAVEIGRIDAGHSECDPPDEVLVK